MTDGHIALWERERAVNTDLQQCKPVSHPGNILLEDILKPLQLSPQQAAEKLGVSHRYFEYVIQGQASMAVTLARRLEAAGVSTARFWLELQMKYDLYHAGLLGIPVGVQEILPPQLIPGRPRDDT